MKNKILCFGLVLIFLASMCGCNAEKADIVVYRSEDHCQENADATQIKLVFWKARI